MNSAKDTNLIQEYMDRLKNEIMEKRYLHSLRVMETCEKLALRYSANVEKAKIAGLLHDCARERTYEKLLEMLKAGDVKTSQLETIQPILLHAKGSAILAKELFGIGDKEIQNAIACHTTGKANMSLLDKIVFLADYIEPGRKFPGVAEIRNMAYNNLGNALTMALKSTIIHVVGQGNMLHPDTVSAYNWLLLKKWGS